MYFAAKARKLWAVLIKKASKEDRKSLSSSDQLLQEDFTGIVQVSHPSTSRISEPLKVILDSGCSAGDLISEQVITDLDLWSEVEFSSKAVGVCLNGDALISKGTLVLRVDGIGMCKIFDTRFNIIPGESLPWQVILGNSTCAKNQLLKVGAYGCRALPVKESKADKAARASLAKRHLMEIKANEAAVKEHKKKNRDGNQQQNSGASSSGTSTSNSGRP